MSQIEIVKWTPKKAGAFEGFATIYVPKWGIEINGIKLFQKEGRRWISMPDREFEHQGEKKYAPYIKFREKTHKDAFNAAVVNAINLHIQQNFQQEPQSSYVNDDSIPF